MDLFLPQSGPFITPKWTFFTKNLNRSTLSYMVCKKVHFFLTSRITDTLSGVEKVHIALYTAPEFWKKSGPFFPKKSKVVQAHHLAPPNWRPWQKAATHALIVDLDISPLVLMFKFIWLAWKNPVGSTKSIPLGSTRSIPVRGSPISRWEPPFYE